MGRLGEYAAAVWSCSRLAAAVDDILSDEGNRGGVSLRASRGLDGSEGVSG